MYAQGVIMSQGYRRYHYYVVGISLVHLLGAYLKLSGAISWHILGAPWSTYLIGDMLVLIKALE